MSTAADDKRVTECLDAITGAAAQREASERAIRFLVFTANQQGASWAQIGKALGVSAQAAHKRYATP